MPTLIVIASLTPLLCISMMLVGVINARRTARRAVGPSPALLIIQITTVGNEETVNQPSAEPWIELAIPYTIWVVTEPWADADYRGADE